MHSCQPNQGRLLACQESLQVTACFAVMECSDDSSHLFGMSIILVLRMSQVARDIMKRSLSKRSQMYAVGSETYFKPFPRVGALTRTRSNEEKKRRRGSLFYRLLMRKVFSVCRTSYRPCAGYVAPSLRFPLRTRDSFLPRLRASASV